MEQIVHPLCLEPELDNIRGSLHLFSMLNKSNEMQILPIFSTALLLYFFRAFIWEASKLSPHMVWFVPGPAATFLYTVDDVRDGRPNHIE